MAYNCVHWLHPQWLPFDHRLRSMACAKATANILDCGFHVHWRDNWACHGEMTDFVQDISGGTHEPIALNIGRRDPTHPRLSAPDLYDRLIAINAFLPQVVTEEQFLDEYEQVCQVELQPTTFIDGQVEAALDAWGVTETESEDSQSISVDLPGVVGLHVPKIGWVNKAKEKIDSELAEDANTKFFLTTARPDVRTAMLEEHSDVILHHNWPFEVCGTSPKGHKVYTTCREQAQDIFTLKLCDRIFGVAGRAMGSLAATMGGVPYESF